MKTGFLFFLLLALLSPAGAITPRPSTEHLWKQSEYVVKVQAAGAPVDKETRHSLVRNQEVKVLAVYKGALKVGQTFTLRTSTGKIESRRGDHRLDLDSGKTIVIFLNPSRDLQGDQPPAISPSVPYHSVEAPNPLLTAELESLVQGESLPEGYRPYPDKLMAVKCVVLASIGEGVDVAKGRSYPIDIKKVWKGPTKPGQSKLLLGSSQVNAVRPDTKSYVLLLLEKWDDGWVVEVKPYPASEKTIRLYDRIKF